MGISEGIRQRSLRHVTVHWDEHTLRHAAMIPLFRADYRVLGMVGLSMGETPIWYPGTPITAAKRELRYKGAYAKSPPPISELEHDVFAGAYYFDPWKVLAAMLALETAYPQLPDGANLARRKIGGRAIRDLIFEPPLHRMRGLVLKGRFGRTRALSILEIPALADALDPPVKQAAQLVQAPRVHGIVGWLAQLRETAGERMWMDLELREPGVPSRGAKSGTVKRQRINRPGNAP